MDWQDDVLEMDGTTDWREELTEAPPRIGPTATLALGLAGFGAMAVAGTQTPLNVGEVSAKRYQANAVIPAPATFGIWSVIYTGMGALLVYQALPSQRDNPRLEAARFWLAAAPWANATWIGLTGYERVYSASAVQIGLWAGGQALHRALGIGQTDVDLAERVLRAPISLYAGWLNVAEVLSALNLAIDLGWSAQTPAPSAWGSAALVATAAGGAWATRELDDPWFGVPFVAAFAGLAAKKVRQMRSQEAEADKRGASTLAKVAGGLAVAGAAWLAPKLVRWAVGDD